MDECNNTTEGHTDIEYDVTLTQGEIGVILSYLEGEYLTLEGKDDIVSNVTRLDITSIFKKLESPVDDHYENHHYPFDGVAEQRRQTRGIYHESICGVDNEQEYIVTECCKAREDSETENTCSVCKKVVYQWVCSKCGWDMNPHMLVI